MATSAEHYADLINRVYGEAMTLNWDSEDLHPHLTGVRAYHWEGSNEVVIFRDDSRCRITYGNGVKLEVLETPRKGESVKLTFGKWTQEVMRHLVERWKWDNPYESLSPIFDPEGKKMQALYDCYEQYRTIEGYMNPGQTAGWINHEFGL